jgi:glycosyltransferase involved in cell wall biosynthesis
MKIVIMDTNRHAKLSSGYGNMARALAEGLARRHHDVYFDSPTLCGDPQLDTLAKKQFVHTPETIYLWTKPPKYILNNNFHVENKNVFFTMHETETFEGEKKEWPLFLNRCKLIITPTEWNMKVFVSAGVTIPVVVVPLAVDTRYYHPYAAPDRFNVLTVHEAWGAESSRENWQMTLEAFRELFSGKNNVNLTVKTWNLKPEVMVEMQKSGMLENVSVTSMSLEPQAMASLYQQHFLFVKNSNREGWSIPLTEAMACGMPVIVYKNPVLTENVRSYPQVSWFTKKDQLKYYLDYWYKVWRTSNEYLSMFSWRASLDRVEDALELL